jgi:peptide chain release factor subunit 1
MKTHLEISEVAPLEWMSINQFLHEVKKIDSQCVSVYYPYGKGKETISLLQETKRSKTLERIESKIENKIIELKKNPVTVGKFTKTLCIFGWMNG